MGELSGSLSIGAYLGKVILALVVLAFSGWLFLLVSKRKGWIQKGSENLYIISSLSLGRDVFFVLRCGPEVIAIVSGPSGTRLMGRWTLKEWNTSEKESKES
ncbi:MAG: hypothetical protein FWH52_00505 [Synergistaceae bacterium]|nr:hypothetical protein [Synergistaceae bacterium]